MLNSRGKTIKRFILICLLWLPLVGESASAQQDEFILKGVFLEQFTRFIDWPAIAMDASSQDFFTITIAGNGPIAAKIQQLYVHKSILGRPVEVRLYEDNNASLDSTDILFISKMPFSELDKIIKVVAGKPILLVSDTEGFVTRGTHINFYTDDEYIKFIINHSALHELGFKVDSRLLKIANVINPVESVR